jgi:hypothetical protein
VFHIDSLQHSFSPRSLSSSISLLYFIFLCIYHIDFSESHIFTACHLILFYPFQYCIYSSGCGDIGRVRRNRLIVEQYLWIRVLSTMPWNIFTCSLAEVYKGICEDWYRSPVVVYCISYLKIYPLIPLVVFIKLL